MTTTVSLNLLLEITAQFDDLAKRYSEELAEKRVRGEVEPQDDKNHDVSAICLSISSFMQSQGFSMFQGELSYGFFRKKNFIFLRKVPIAL